jgi:argininosuccinate lyase
MGKLTAYSLGEKRNFPDLTLEEYRQFSPVFEPDLFKVLDLKTALKARKAIGAPSPSNVGSQITRWQKRLHAAASI